MALAGPSLACLQTLAGLRNLLCCAERTKAKLCHTHHHHRERVKTKVKTGTTATVGITGADHQRGVKHTSNDVSGTQAGTLTLSGGGWSGTKRWSSETGEDAIAIINGGGKQKRMTLNPEPYTPNPQFSTLNPQPKTLNPQPSTLNPEI